MNTDVRFRWAGYTLAAMCLCAVTACLHDAGPEGRAVAFDTRVETHTRGTEVTALRKIGVFGYTHAGSWAANEASLRPDHFFNKAVVDRPGDGTWTYDGVHKYWPPNDIRVSFFAYAPYIDVENTFTLYPDSTYEPGAPTIDYSVPAGLADQIDLLWARSVDQTYESNGGVVELEMNHAMTRVDFEVKLDENETGPLAVEITGMTLRNLTGSGVLDLSKSSTDAGLWTSPAPTGVSDLAKYTITPDSGLKTIAFDARSGEKTWCALFEDGQYLMLIPQALGDKGIGCPAEIVLELEVTNSLTGTVEAREQVLPLSLPDLDTWKPGMGVTYKIILCLTDGSRIEFDIEGFIGDTPWDKVEDSIPQGTVG